ncbi:MAG: hypothetical protein IPH74_07500 [Bacteroidetes bacterium]|nr:hypothetical protein [Bacteroidota bacterium]MBK9353754.1 hypothetical protein [Bacteroidota bacterium]MBK9634877.1 hypothetical protein [Bacteroidota bacterium]MBP7255894.1 hypothetical protein [Chitinophagales bacterium]
MNLNVFNFSYLKNTIFLVLSMFFICTISCKKTETVSSNSNNKISIFFPLDSFANAELERHLNIKTQVEKTISLNSKTEKHLFDLDTTGWKKELSPLFKNDINKVAWVDKFKQEEIKKSNGEYSLIYTTFAKEIKVKKLQIDFDSLDHVQLITIIIESNNLIFQADQKYTYSPTQGYTLFSDQKALFLSKNSLEVRGNFINSKPL